MPITVDHKIEKNGRKNDQYRSGNKNYQEANDMK